MPVTLSNPAIINTADRSRNHLTSLGQHLNATDIHDEQAAKAFATALFFAITGTLCIVSAFINEMNRQESFKADSEASTINTPTLTNVKWRGIASAFLVSISLISTVISAIYYFRNDFGKTVAQRSTIPTESTPLLPPV